MIPDELDRILASEETLLPSSGFLASVMEQIQETAAAPPPLRFPWSRFLLALVAVAVLTGLSGWGIASLPVAETLSSTLGRALMALQDPHLALALGGSVASLAGTFLLLRLTLGFTGARR